MPADDHTGARPVTNWAGNVQFGASRVHRPSSVTELRRLVAGSRRIRALGTGHSFNPIADSPGALVSVAGLPPAVTVDATAGSATVAAGIRYGQLVTRLQRAGFGLPSLASLPHISVAGACATATHGSGDRVGNLATAVSGLELVTADGDLVQLRRDTGGDRFRGAVVALGALGVVTRLTLDLVPAYQVSQYVYDDLPHEVLAEHWAQVFGAAYSVSVFTTWTGPAARQVWLKQRLPGPADWPPPAGWLGARRAGRARHPIPGHCPQLCTEQLGAPGAWYARLPHFRPESIPSSGQELQSEYLLPRHRAGEVLAALDRVRHRIAPALQVCELRTVAADDLWLSPSYRRDTLAVHFTWVADLPAVTRAVTAVEEQLAPLAARPHWGKLFGLPPEQVRGSYPRWADFAALTRELDPDGRFRNDFLDRLLPAWDPGDDPG
jgi:xylitol oxidase